MDRAVKGVPLPKGKAPAFTLMEVIITMTLLGFIVLMVFGVFRLGLSAWERGETTKEEYQRVRIASQLISRQLKSILAYKIKTQGAEGDFLAFEGKARSLKFVSAYSLKANRPSGFVFALYEFREGERGKGRLVFYEQRATNRDFMEDKPSEEIGVPLFEGIRDVRFEYFRAGDPEKNLEAGWVEEWNGKEAGELPRALRMILTFAKEQEKGTEPSWVLMTSLPSYRYEAVRTFPSRRFAPPVSR